MSTGPDASQIVAWGQEEAARANHLPERQQDSEQRIRRRVQPLLVEARGLRKLWILFRMHRMIRRARRRLDIAPLEGLYLQKLHSAEAGEVTAR